jgi:cytochrome c oxidase subunit 3
LFLLFYFIMTGLHAVHLIIGVGVVMCVAIQAWRGRYSPNYYAPVEVTGLYWHFVDIVWIFLLPMLYLLGTHGHH